MKNFLKVNRALTGAKKTNLLNNLLNWVLKKGTSRSQVGTKSWELPGNPRPLRYLCATLALPLRYVAMIFAVLVMSMANIGMAWADTELAIINFKSWTPQSISAGSTVNGCYFKSAVTISAANGATFGGNATTSSNWVAIPLSGINGSITITLTHANSRPQWKNYFKGLNAAPSSSDLSSNPSSVGDNTRPGSNTTTSSWTISTDKLYGVFYVGKGSNGLNDIYSISISTPDWTYYYRGADNSWGGTEMTKSSGGFYSYTSSTTNNHQFKIAKSADGWDYNHSYVDAGYLGTSITTIGDYSSDNCYIWSAPASYYIIVFRPGSPMNTTANPKICASATLPAEKFTISFNNGGGSGSMSSISNVLYGSDKAITANTFTKDGYRFTGWHANVDVKVGGATKTAGTLLDDEVTIQEIKSDITLTAQWEVDDGCNKIFWFANSADATTNGVTNNTTTFSGVNTGNSAVAGSITIDGKTYTATGRGSNNSTTITFTVPANKVGTLYGLANSSGSSARTLTLTNTDSYSETQSTSASSSTAGAFTFEDMPAGSYSLAWSGNGAENMLCLKLCDAGESCSATQPGAISKGTLSSCSLPLTASGSPASNNTWYWQSAADGTDKTGTSGATKNVTSTGTYYIRSYYSTGDCWSEAQTVTVSASDLTPAAPSALAKSAETAKGVTLTVTDTPNTNDYDFYVSTSSSAPDGSTPASYTSTNKSITITDKIAGTTYYAWARAKCGSYKSAWTALTNSTFTTSTVTMTPTLTNVTHTSGATSGIGGSDYTAVFTADAEYSMPNPTVTIGGNAATSGTDYTWSVEGSVGTITIPANKINGNIVITLNSADAAPSSAAISGTYHYFPGENISLTCTPSGNNGPTTYQWYKGSKADGNAIEGATSATYTKNSCAFEDAGSYYCKVTCNATSIWAETNSAENYDVKILRLYVNGSKSGDPYGNVDFTKVDGTTATASISLGSNWTYGFNIADGCGHYYGNAGTMQENNCTNWTTNVNGTDCGLRTTNAATYIFTINYSNLAAIVTSVTYPIGNQASGKVIYFDNNVRNWTGSSIYYRIGHSTHSQADQLSLVPGTANLYKMTTREYNGFSGWHIANAIGDVGSGKSIYKTVDGTQITEATAHEGGAVTQAAITVTPTTSKGMGADVGVNDNCEFFNYTITSGMKTQNVAISPYTNGTITVNYTNTSGSAATLTSGNADLAHTVILTSITAVADAGYDASAITINGNAYAANYVVTGATTIAASFTPHVYSITYKDQGDVAFSGTHVDSPNAHPTSHTYATATTLNSATKDGYTFGGWYTSPDCSTGLVTTLGATDYTADITLYAKWTVNSHTLTWNFDGGSSSETAGTHYTAGGSVNYGATITYPSNGSMSKPGNAFTGWSSTPSTMPDNDLTITALWEDACPTANSGAVVYKWEVKSNVSDGNICTTQNVAVSLNTTTHLTTLTGGTLEGMVTSSSMNNLAFSSGRIQYANGSAGVLILTLDCAVKTGDVIRFVNYSSSNSKYNYLRHTSSSTSTNQITLNASTTAGTVQEIVVPAAFNDKKVLYIVSGSNTTGISYFEIIRPYTTTLDANTNGGKVNGENTEVHYNVSGETITLPHATKTDYYFKGWYTTSDGNTKADNPYTPTGTTTLYAQWEDCPDDGTVYKWQVKSGLTNGDVTEGDVNTINYLSTLIGGTVTAHQNSSKLTVVSNSKFQFADNNVYLKLDLDCPLRTGDKFKTTIETDKLCITSSASRSTTNSLSIGSLLETAVPAGLVGATTLYIWRNGTNSKISYFEVIRPEKFAVTYHMNDGSATTQVNNVTAVEENMFTRNGYTFVKWNTQADGNGTDKAVGSAVTAAMDLFAIWECTTPTYDTDLSTTPHEVREGDATVTLTVAASANSGTVTYQWYSNTSKSTAGATTLTTGATYNAPTSSIGTLYYYCVATNTTGGGCTTQSAYATVTVSEVPCFEFKAGTTKAGSGWDVPNNGAITTALWTDGSQILTGGSLTNTSGSSLGGNASYGLVYAANGNKQVTVALTGNNILVAGSVITITGYSNNSTDACGFTINGNDMSPATYTPASADYKKFTQTYTVVASDGVEGEASFTIDSKTSIRAYLNAITITGCGEISYYSVTYAANGATEGTVPVDANSPYEEGETVTVLGNTGWLFKSGYEFGGWSDGVNTYAADATFTMPAEDVTLTAVWTSCTKPGTPSRPAIEEGTITHEGAKFYCDPVGGTANSSGYMVSIVKVSDGSTVLDWTDEGIESEGGAPVYTATGLDELTAYHFIVRAIGTDGYCDYGDTARLTFGTLATPYAITYHLNGASWINEGAATYIHGIGYTLPVAGDMSNTGYTFGGWYDNSGLTGSAVTEIGTSETGEKEFWAKWTENTFTITYNANGGTGSMTGTTGHYVTIKANEFTKDDYIFAGWNTAIDGSGLSYNAGEEIELTTDMTLYAQWGSDYTITWDASAKLSGVDATPNLGGGNYTITASVATWTGTLTSEMISALTDGVTITNVDIDNSATPKTITATFNVGASVAGTSISLELDVPAYGVYGAKSSTKSLDIDRCTGSSSGSDGVLFSAEFKDSGLGTSNICDAANTAYTFTTTELKAAAAGGSIKAYTTSTLSHMKFAENAISIAGSDGVIRIDLDNAVATNDLFTYVNVNSSTSAAYLRHTSADNTTDQIALTVYNSKEAKVRLTSGFNGKTTLYIVRNNKNFNLHKAAVVRPAFLMLLRDDTPTASSTNLEGTDVELTTSTYLTTISGGQAYFTSPASGNLKIYRSSSKNYINFNNAAGYIKVVLNDALQEGDVIGFDSYNTNNLAFTTTATRSTSIVTTNQLYTVDGSSALKGETTFYIWQNSGSSDYLRGLQIARSGVAGGGGGTDQITPTLTWTPALNTDADWDNINNRLNKETGDADFTFTVTQDMNSLGAITYSSSNTSVATVNATTGKVHIAGAAGTATITATMAESGCYKQATATYNINVVDNCEDVAGTIGTVDLGCSGIQMTVTGHTTTASTSYQWYKDGAAIGGATSDNYTATAAGEYYVVVTNTGEGHCPMASTNTVVLENQERATATKIVDEWYIKNGRRTPDIALVQTEHADNFQVKSGSSPISTFAGCTFYLGDDGIIYLKGQKDDGTEPSGLTEGDETLKFTATACGGNSDELSITIHKQAATTRPSVAFVVDGTKEGDFDAENEDHSVNTELYQFLDYGADAQGAFDLTGQNVYSTVDEKAIREHYSQFDAILITDDPSTDTKIGKKSCVDAFGTMIDIRPILTMEAFVAKWSNWKAKGIDGNPSSPNPRQYAMKLDCKNHAIFMGIDPESSNVLVEDIDGVEYWTVTMVDKTQSPYAGVADDTDTESKPALQGFSASDVSGLMLLGEISGGTLYAGVERQEEPAARLLLLGVNNKALPNALTPEGKKIIENALTYLIETDMEKVDDCSNYFIGGTEGKERDWNTDTNWSKGIVPNSPYVKARILKPCVLSGLTAKVARVDIATSGKSMNLAEGDECSGSLTIDPTGALIVGSTVHSAVAPYFNTGDLMPTTANDLVLNTSSSAQSALVFNNDKGDTKATVNLYSLGRKDGSYLYQYFAIPMEYLAVSPTFANETHGGTKILTYAYSEAGGWERRGYYNDLYAFEGLGITTGSAADHMSYTMTGTLASTTTKEINMTNTRDGFNLIGNSWSAPIQINQLAEDNTDDNIVKTAYIYCTGHDGGTGAVNPTEGAEAAGQWIAIPFNTSGTSAWRLAGKLSVIPAMQAFQIKANAEATLTLDYKKVVRGSTNSLTEKLRAPKRASAHSDVPMSIIRVKDSKTYTDVCLLEGEFFSDEFDNGWEAEYMAGDGPSATLYAETEIGHMAVAAMPEIEGTVLGFAPGKELEYTFTFLGADMGYYLNDIKLRKSTLINAENSYTFTFEEGDTNRFYISRTPFDAPGTATGIESTSDASTNGKARKLIIEEKMYILYNGRIYDAQGKVVK